MPLDEKTTSKFDDRYCIYCQDQKTGELGAYERVREGTIQATMKMQGLSRGEAEEQTDRMLPGLPRWQDK